MNPRAAMVNNWHTSEHNNTRLLRAEDIAANCNLINDLMVNVGMIRLSNTEFLGQSGVATHLTPNEGETQIIKPSGSSTTDLIKYAYKHPVLDVYVKIDFRLTRYMQNTIQLDKMSTTYTVFRNIINGEISGDSFTYRTSNVSPAALLGGVANYITGDISVFAYCDDDGFWIASNPTAAVSPNIAASANAMANFAPICFLIQRDIESNHILLMGGQHIAGTSSGSSPTDSIYGADVRGINGIVGQMPCTWFTKPTNKTITRTGATVNPFTTLPQPNVANKNGAVRVFAAETHWQDESISTWNFGTVNNGAMTDGAVGLIDLLGTGSPREYMAIKGFGPVVDTVATTQAYYNPNDHLQLLLPWVS